MDSALGTGNSAPNLAHPLCFAGMHLAGCPKTAICFMTAGNQDLPVWLATIRPLFSLLITSHHFLRSLELCYFQNQLILFFDSNLG
jgi:hypothetical protein